MIRADRELCILDFRQSEEEIVLCGLRMLVDTYHIFREGFSRLHQISENLFLALVDRHVLNQLVQ